MQQTPGNIAAAVQRGLAPVYLVAGEEPLLMQESLDAIRAAARAKGYSEREVLDVEKGFDWQRLHDACNAMSLFASLRIVEARMTGAPDAAGAQALIKIAKDPPRDVLLLVTAGKVEWKSRNGGWFAALNAAGVSVYTEPMKPAELPAWIGVRLRAASLDAEPEALRLLADRTEGNLLAAQQEIRKLALLNPPGACLGLKEIEDAVADSAHIETFGWIDKILAGDARGAVRGLDVLRGEGVDVIPIVGGVAFALRELAKASVTYARSRDASSAVQGLRIQKTSHAAYARAVERVSKNHVLGWLRKCAQINRLAMSTGGQTQAWEELLTLVLAASGAAGKKAALTRR